ncbi:MAG: glycosyltransferase [Candidatus Abyssobacteria bacterium SURF_5]|uniref:Glycosyltransferase n=1 Tax=Abyssobacteria bacterium (strain SURF_5) TaxID=2093360 RepID=A0A3A4NYY7_ABYX5|nr:MAG: glycosyltransferase [Candidatus Abyssubacteria bacterium SURF_5]
MKILHVYKDYYPPVVGGIEKHIAQVCNHLKKKHEVQVLVCNRGFSTEIEHVDGVRVVKVGQLGRLQSAPIPPAFALWLRRLEADILHFHLPNPTCELSYLLARPPGAVVATYHSDIVRQEFLLRFYSPFLRSFLRKTRLILPTSPVYAEGSLYLREFAHKCRVVPLGVDTHLFDSISPVKEEVNALHVRYGQEFILFVGKLRYYKGLQFLIRAMPRIPVPLVIVGTGPMEDELKGLAILNGVKEKVHFAGEVSDMDLAAYYHACSLFVLPSIYRSEAYGLVQLEAHACGKPVVSTRLGTGVEYVNLHLKTGCVVPPADPDALAAAIESLLNDPKRRQEMGEFARQRVCDEFDLDRMFHKIEDVYQEALESR